MSDDIKLGLWFNETREKPTHPHIKAGKPVTIDGQEYWLSGWINYPKEEAPLGQRIITFLLALAEKNGKYPIISLSLRRADQQTPKAQGSGNVTVAINEEKPF